MGARLVESLVTLRRQVNELAPSRDRSHDGWIGDAAHRLPGPQVRPQSGS